MSSEPRGQEKFDVVVVGARCAGSPLAAMLARRGLRVCLVDRSRFPSDSLSTHVIQPRGVAILDRLGVLDAALAAGAAPLTRLTFVAEDARMDAAIDAKAFGAPALSMRRLALDYLLVETAASAGAAVRTETAVNGLIWEGDRVGGVETKDGPLRARLVVGADGRSSTVAGLVGASEYRSAPPGRMFAWAYFEGTAEDEGRLRLGSIEGLTFAASPTDSGLYLAAVCPPLERKDAFLADREAGYMEGIAAWPELHELLAGANRLGPIRVMTSWHGYFREAAGPGWALLGDAGHSKDPSPAQGIADALGHAERLADAIETGLDSDDIDSALRHWWRWRDNDGYEMHWFAADLGASGTRPVARQYMQDMIGDEDAIEDFLRVLNHEIPPSRLLTPRRLARAGARAVRSRPGQLPAMASEVATELRNTIHRSRQRRHPSIRSTSLSLSPAATATGAERLLLGVTVAGLLIPIVFFGAFFATEGADLGRYFSLWTATLPSTQILLDLAVASLALFIWAAIEGPRAGVRRWWLCIPATLLVGLSFGLPLFFLMRERALSHS